MGSVLAGPVEFSAFDIAMILLIVASPAIVVGIVFGFIMARRQREPGERLAYGIGMAVMGFLAVLAIEIALAGIF